MPLNKKPHKKDAPHWRHNYEDHSLKFLDWAEHLGVEKNFFGRFLIFLNDKVRLRTVLFVIFFSFTLSYLLFFELEAPMDLNVGDVSKVDITSPMSFSMTDEISTEDLRNRAQKNIAPVFKYDPKQFEAVTTHLYQAFKLMRAHVKEQVWNSDANKKDEQIKEFSTYKAEFEKELGSHVSEYLFEWLVRQNFSVQVENIIEAQLRHWYMNKVYDGHELTAPIEHPTVTFQELKDGVMGRELQIDVAEINDFSSEEFSHLDVKGSDKFSSEDQKNILELAQIIFVPSLVLNKELYHDRQQVARNGVAPVTMNIKKNQILVSSGTTVGPRHLAILRELQSRKHDVKHSWMSFISGFLFVALILIFLAYLKRFTVNRVKLELKDMMVMGTVTIGVVLITKLYLFITDAAFVSRFGQILPPTFFLYAAPVATAPMLVGLLITSGEIVWLFTAFVSIVLGIMVDMDYPFMLVNFAAGIAAARAVQGCKKRNDIYRAGLKIGLVNATVAVAILSLKYIEKEGFSRDILMAVPAGFLAGISSSLFTMIFIPLLESLFNYTTDVKLLELSNLNHPLLKEMIVRAPGTYHHSMMVGSMVEAAAEEIGANPLLGKVMCYYHDIGKMEHANYFIENQKPGQNPHDHISPFMSKTLLVAHVKDGVEMGMQYKLGKPIIDGIIQHHGTTLISYFFNKAIEQRHEDDPEIQDEDFRYPGPKPQFREAALCMLADSIEAAARSLDEPTPMRLQNIVKNIIQRKFMDGQLDECNLTLKDLSKVEMAFIRILLGIYHQRIDYPRNAGGGAAESPASVVSATNGNKPSRIG